MQRVHRDSNDALRELRTHIQQIRILELCSEIAPCLLSEFVAIALQRGLPGAGLAEAIKEFIARGFIVINGVERMFVTPAGFAAVADMRPLARRVHFEYEACAEEIPEDLVASLGTVDDAVFDLEVAQESLDSVAPETKDAFFDLDASVFAPTQACAGSDILVQVYMHQPHDKSKVMSRAGAADEEAEKRGTIELGAVDGNPALEVSLEGGGLEVKDPPQTVVWRGKILCCQFSAGVPAGSHGKQFHPTVLVCASSVPLGRLKFVIRSAQVTSVKELSAANFRRYRYAFLSYASADRRDVLRGAQLLRSVGINFFNDLLSLEPGERWERRLYQEIDRADLFLLFWSSHAKRSEWVEKEIAYALGRQEKHDEDAIDIRPVLLEGPPAPEPPLCLQHIHFNDYLMHVIASSQTTELEVQQGLPPHGR